MTALRRLTLAAVVKASLAYDKAVEDAFQEYTGIAAELVAVGRRVAALHREALRRREVAIDAATHAWRLALTGGEEATDAGSDT